MSSKYKYKSEKNTIIAIVPLLVTNKESNGAAKIVQLILIFKIIINTYKNPGKKTKNYYFWFHDQPSSIDWWKKIKNRKRKKDYTFVYFF